MSDALNKEFQRDYWDHNANLRSYNHPIVKCFVQQRIDYLMKHLDFGKIERAYDVGCGDGFATYYFDQVIDHVDGGDISESMLELNPLSPERLSVIDAEDLPLEDSSYDLVYTWEVLHHVPDPQKVVQEMARATNKFVVIFEPNRTNPMQLLFGLLHKQERGTLRSTRRFLETLCNNAGLKIIASDYCGKIPPNRTPMWAFNIVKRLPFISNVLTGISIVIIAEKRP